VRVARELVEVKLARQATQQKKKEGPHRGPSLYFQTPELNLGAGLPQLSVGLSFFYLSTESRVTALPAGEKCAGVSRRVSSRDGVCDDALRRAAWMGCRTLPAPELAGLRKVPIDKIPRRTLKRCASLESPLGNPP